MNRVVLNDVINIISGGTPKTSNPDYWNGNIGWLSVVDFNDDNRMVYSSSKTISEKGMRESSTKMLNIGDIIISARGTVGALAQIGKPMCFNQSCFGIRGKKDVILNDYLYYTLKNYITNIKKKTQGSVFETINLNSFTLMDIDIHTSLEEQQSISKVLSTIDDKIELNNKINKELEQMAKTLYDYWFVQFEFPDEFKRAYKSSNGTMVYNKILKREIPAGWEVASLFENSLTKLIKTGISIFKGEKIYLPTACISEDRITDTTTKITYENRESRANMMPIPNSVWFAKMKNTNKHLYFGDYSQNRISKIILSTGMCGFKCQDYALEYIWNFIQNKQFENIKDVLASGAIQPAINNNDLNSIYILIPDTNILKMYSQKVKSLLQMKYNNEEEIFKLEKLRDFLLPMLMNEQVKVEQQKPDHS